MLNPIIKKSVWMALTVLMTSSAAFAAEVPAEKPAVQKISIGSGFKRLWHDTGIYRFINPRTAEEKKAEYINACVQTADAETNAGHFDSAQKNIGLAAKVGVDVTTLQTALDAAIVKGLDYQGLLPEGLGQFVMILVGL
ncbi:MAG: hypothetical protein JZU63_14195, partial [Rhodoferax sp.]|nr:hypothetical protein [Rhodoferax sp.]